VTGTTDLPAALRSNAQGLHCREAAAEFLIGHACWLQRDDFIHHFVHIVPDLIDGTSLAPIDWPEAIAALDQGQPPCSGSEGRILRLVASLADGVSIDLQNALTRLDNHNAELVSHGRQTRNRTLVNPTSDNPRS